MNLRIAFFHGLESPSISDKSEFLTENFDAWCPAMNYHNDHNIFKNTLAEVKRRNIDLLIGSSMGGWFAYCISTHTGIPTLLFNPALNQRSFSPKTSLGQISSDHTLILGIYDNVIDCDGTEEWLESNDIEDYTIKYERMGHRTPIEIFEKHVNHTTKQI